MKDIVAMVAVVVAAGSVGWCFGTGVMHTEAAGLLLASWIALTWSCLPE